MAVVVVGGLMGGGVEGWGCVLGRIVTVCYVWVSLVPRYGNTVVSKGHMR